MAYRSRVQCDNCQKEENAPQDGGFPFGWCEINIKPSFRGKELQEKRRRYHLCDECTAKCLKRIVDNDDQRKYHCSVV